VTINDIQSGDGWFGLALALLNVLQSCALAYLASYAARRRDVYGESARIRQALELERSRGSSMPSGRGTTTRPASEETGRG
jgi:hypothetical protein